MPIFIMIDVCLRMFNIKFCNDFMYVEFLKNQEPKAARFTVMGSFRFLCNIGTSET